MPRITFASQWIPSAAQRIAGLLLGIAPLISGACSESTGDVHSSFRLVDHFSEAKVSGSPETPADRKPIATWDFSDADADAWTLGQEVEALRIEDGALLGTTTGDFPVIHTELPHAARRADQVVGFEIDMTLSEASEVHFFTHAGESLDLAGVLEWWRLSSVPVKTPVVGGEESRRYRVVVPSTIRSSEPRHLLLRPGNRAGLQFRIRAIRLIYRQEQLAAMPTGIRWQGLSEVYRETLVARAPETIEFETRLPERPWLDLAVGMLTEGALSFRVTVQAGTRNEPELVLQKTLTRAHRWEELAIDLHPFAKRKVKLRLELEAEDEGKIGFWGCPVVRDTVANPRSVIFVLVDTLRPDHLEAYGYERATAPVLAALAEEGVLFEQCHAQGTWTKVSAASIFTSLYPSTHGIRRVPDRLPDSVTTLAEVFREAGYATLAYSSVPFTGRLSNLQQGYEVMHEVGSLRESRPAKSSREFVDRLLPWLERHNDVPHFVLLHVFDPHDPYEPDAPYDVQWADPKRREAQEHDRGLVREKIANPLLRRFAMPTRSELEAAGVDAQAYLEHEQDWYDGSIRGMDTELGRVLEALRENELEQGALVVVTSDHGEEFHEHGRMFHGQSVHGELTRVPLVLWGPASLPLGRRIEQPVASLDIAPTILELAGLTVPEGLQGQSLLPALQGSVAELQRGVISEKAAITGDALAPPPHETASTALLYGDWKLIHHTARSEGTPEFQLFDWRADPFEQNDVAGEYPEQVRSLREHLEAWRTRMEAAASRIRSAGESELQASDLKALQELGYAY